ncbi:MAG: alpha/beta hydrolase family protein, partial [Cryomorphaceae bacterium]
MKRIIFTLSIFIAALLTIPVQAQEFSGSWSGVLDARGTLITFIIHFKENSGDYTSEFDSPEQSAFGIPFDSTNVKGNEVRCIKVDAGIIYEGTLDKGVIKGTFTQGIMELPLELERKESGYMEPQRPQTPQEPFPYRSEEVEISNPLAGIILRGTLTLPEGQGPFPSAVLITGSGPQNRDCEVAGHKPFLVLADHLTRNGIAVLRYDDRGTAGSTGRFDGATTSDFADDAEAVF